jgi:formylglycine-generating enzyme required for sulfatase activity/predicted Ser/Thr protein kinase
MFVCYHLRRLVAKGMSSPLSFVGLLRSFQSGQLSHNELLEEINRHLTLEKASPITLLETLEAEQSMRPLRSDVHESILTCIRNWPQDATVITRLSAARSPRRRRVVGVGDVLLGRFELIELLGEGGMSRVFKAIDLRRVEAGATDLAIAVKVLTEPFSEYFGSITALQREATKLQGLAHSNIVRVIDCDRDGQTVFMTMEYLTGESLRKKLRAPDSADFDRSAAESIISAIADALEYAHANYIVHGDLKPGNVIITTQGVTKVIDFGMARFVVRPGSATAHPDVHPDETPKAVTPRYASPQMLAGLDPTPGDDVYALACIAYESLSGKVPFDLPRNRGKIDSDQRPPRPREMPTHQYLALVKALAFDPKDRTPTVRQFRDELLAIRGKRAKRWAWAGAAVVALALFALYRLPLLHPSSSALPVEPHAPAAGSVIRDCPTCPLMTVLPVGFFTQGADSGDPDLLPFERPPHAVVIGYPLAMGKNEVTVGEFREFADATQRNLSGCNTYDGEWHYQPTANWQAPGFAQGAEHPVACTSWRDAIAYAKWLSEKTGHTYRLPSASEWEYAARTGTELTQSWASNAAAACADANVADQTAAQRFPGWATFPCSDGYVNTAPVGSFRANAFGVNDLLGNVFEWVEDCWHPDYNGAPADGSARLDGDCQEHELRGGSWFSSPRFVNAAYRNRFDAGYRSSAVGFRLVREVSK